MPLVSPKYWLCFDREEDRDISERIALGQAQPTMTSASLFDARLFNQASNATLNLNDEEAYSVYDRPFVPGSGNVASSIYRPRKDADPELDPSALEKIARTDRFTADRGFQGADKAEKRNGAPVQFEKGEETADPFGLDAFLTDAKKGKRGLDVVGSRGSMAAKYVDKIILGKRRRKYEAS